MAHTYEVEIKSLLGDKANADALRTRLKERFSELVEKGKHAHLNHYFVAPTDLSLLQQSIAPYIAEDKHADLARILSEGKNHSIRTRDADGKVLFIVKASIGDDTSANGVSRIEFESPVVLSIEALDQILLDAGLSYQAKWSREREDYEVEGMNITIDKNAGYGYLAEFEKILTDESDVPAAREELARCMAELGVTELPQDRLERMFAHYNAHWNDYYGTDNIFVIE
ncbi:MAG: CYTH domain-containing protein [Candidatus Pacebacteria bacterium]|nr:CYTH domain-containing protein [Candidatus Paceibacterota bacterium]